MFLRRCVLLIGWLFFTTFHAVAASPPTIYVLEPGILQALEGKGFSLNETLGDSGSVSRTADLYKKSRRYQSFADTIGLPLPHDKKTDQLPFVIPENSGDVPDMVRRLRDFEDKGARSDKDLKKGYFIRHVANNSQYPYEVERDGDEPRHFDSRWLNSKFGFFKLVAIANRMDRKDLTKDSCGEVRFIYRLSYKSQTASSSLPFFVTAVRQYPLQSSCAEFAKAWTLETVNATALAAGPLRKLEFRQLEVNFQSLRFTSGYMHDFGGQAMYMQRVFRPVNGNAHLLAPAVLENTPDVLAIRKDPALLKSFVEYLKKPENLRALDMGVLDIDFNPKFLAKLSISWSTLGRVRTANRPYTSLFENNRKLVDSIDITGLKYIKTHDALIERLNNLTCMGCHQSGGTAGFHTLGAADPNFSHPFNRQQLAQSPHSLAEVSRRVAWVSSIAQDQKPNAFRPHSSFSAAQWQTDAAIPKFMNLQVGNLCISEKDIFHSQPTCGTTSGRPTECVKTVTVAGKNPLLGECILKDAVRAAGHACWKGQISESQGFHAERNPPTSNFFAFADKWTLSGPVLADFKDYSCVLPQSGAPLGRMGKRCTLAEENFNVDLTQTVPDELCANQGGSGFDMCAASGNSGACLETKVARSMLDTCTESRFCREDYICQKFPDYDKISAKDYVRKKGTQLINLSVPEKIDGNKIEEARRRGIGFCVPTYFLFNMRIDGHPSPVTGLPPSEPKIDRSQPLRGYK